MSTNCINCVKNERTGLDLLCDDCRTAEKLRNKGRITGQVIIREVKENLDLADGRKLVIIFGILALPKDSDLKSEHQYPVFGDVSNVVRIAEEQGQDVSAQTIGNTPGGLLSQPIWRV
jgi:hypothetical protein